MHTRIITVTTAAGTSASCAAPTVACGFAIDPICVICLTADGMSRDQARNSKLQTGADMTPRIPENISAWLVEWRLVTIMGNTMPPRDPSDDDDEDEEDEEDEDRHEEPPVVREPDE
jgi:hypothetical protein